MPRVIQHLIAWCYSGAKTPFRARLHLANGHQFSVIVQIPAGTPAALVRGAVTHEVTASAVTAPHLTRIGDITLAALSAAPSGSLDLPVNAEGPIHPPRTGSARC